MSNLSRYVSDAAALLAIVVLQCAMPGPVQARPMPPLDYQKQFDASDLVVIATPTAKTADTTERSFLGASRVDQDRKLVPDAWIGVETPFSISVVLKGDMALRQFTLHHYRETDDAIERPHMNGPHLVSFPGPNDSTNLHSYLLFLVREADGRYAPTGGQIDPGYYAVFPLTLDWPPREQPVRAGESQK